MGRLSQTLSQPIRCPGRRDVSYYASKASPSSAPSLSAHHTNVFHQYSHGVYSPVPFSPVNVDIWRKWVIQTPSWTCGLSACAPCWGGAAPKLTGLHPVKPVLSQSRGQVESRCWSDRSRNKSRGETVEADAEE